MLDLDSTSVGVACWQGKLEEAIELLKKATAIDLKIYGPDHAELATDYNNLAGVYQDQASSHENPVKPSMVPHGEGEPNGSLKFTVKYVSYAQVRCHCQVRCHFFKYAPAYLRF